MFLFFACLTGIIYLLPYYSDVFSDNRFTVCIMKNLIGIDCPGCGFGRSIVLLLHGEIHHSLRYYPTGIAIFVYGIFKSYKSDSESIGLFSQESLFEKFSIYSLLIIIGLQYFVKIYNLGMYGILSNWKTGMFYRYIANQMN